jgi:hypothetical protein
MTLKDARKQCRKVGTAHASGDALRSMYAELIAMKFVLLAARSKVEGRENQMRQHYIQSDRERFYAALTLYRMALESGNSRDIVIASLRVHAAKAGVPKSYWPQVNRAFKETYRTRPLKGATK